MKNSKNIKKLVGIASLAAVVVVLQLLANYIAIGNVSITLALIPIVVGAILYGPLAGTILGCVMGLMAMIAPSTIAFFMPHNPVATIILCLLKAGLAGAVSGWIFKLLSKKNFVLAIILASIACPIVNTGIFLIGGGLFFAGVYGASNALSAFGIIFVGIWMNFVIEFIVNSLLSPAVISIVKVAFRNFDLGTNLEYEDNNEFERNEEILD